MGYAEMRARPSFWLLPPVIFQSMLSHPGRHAYDLSSLRLSVMGSASVAVELVRRMQDELGFEAVIQGYGLTEATGIATSCRPGDPLDLIATSAGRAMPGVEVRVVDRESRDCEHGQPGELRVLPRNPGGEPVLLRRPRFGETAPGPATGSAGQRGSGARWHDRIT